MNESNFRHDLTSSLNQSLDVRARLARMEPLFGNACLRFEGLGRGKNMLFRTFTSLIHRLLPSAARLWPMWEFHLPICFLSDAQRIRRSGVPHINLHRAEGSGKPG